MRKVRGRTTRRACAVASIATTAAVAMLQACGGSSSDHESADAAAGGGLFDATTSDGGPGRLLVDGQSPDGSPDTGPLAIPATFFGQHVNTLGALPLQVPYGYLRLWDNPAQWPSVETCDPSGPDGGACFSWDALDTEMLAVKAAGVGEVMVTLSRTPAWAAPEGVRAPSPACDYGGTSCYPPRDLAADGSGTDSVWIGWVAALAAHVNAPGYAASHGHIHVYEPWNEFYRSPLTAPYWGSTSFLGTYAQLVRLTEDLRCVVKGVGTVHNYPAAGDATPCSTFLAAMKRTAIDPDALITTPSVGFGAPGSIDLQAMQNFLYCTADAGASAGCTTGSGGSEAVDIINLHLYPETVTPETALGTWIPASKAILSPVDLAKPLFSGEGSWGMVPVEGSLWAHDGYERAGFIPRYFALGWSAGLSQMFWYAYDNDSWGQLFDRPRDGGTPSLDTPESTGWKTTYAWLVGAVPSAASDGSFCQHQGTIYTCDFLQKGTIPSRLVWDASFDAPEADGGRGCLAYADPWTCGSGTYPVGSAFTTVQRLSADAPVAITGGTVVIGANPVLLQ